MVDKIFIYKNIHTGEYISLNAISRADTQNVLKLYITWYNNEFAPFEKPALKPRNINEWKFIDSFIPIDFYEESRKL